MADILAIDGAAGEGGGQILRTTLTLAAVTRRAVRITNIRAGRRSPGLAAQHVVACKALAAATGATLEDAFLHSEEIVFHPGPLQGGDFHFDVSEECPSAGSVTLILQAMLPALLFAAEPSTVTIHGGTEVPWSPVFDYFSEVYAPLLRRFGACFAVERQRAGWYPAGGGIVHARVEPLRAPLQGQDLRDRGELRTLCCHSTVERRLPAHIVSRQIEGVAEALGPWGPQLQPTEGQLRARNPGTTCLAQATFERGAAGYSALGKSGKPAEQVGAEAGEPLRAFLEGRATVDERLADQLLLPAALAAGPTTYISPLATSHLTTNALVLSQLLGLETTMASTPDGIQVTLTGLGLEPNLR